MLLGLFLPGGPGPMSLMGIAVLSGPLALLLTWINRKIPTHQAWVFPGGIALPVPADQRDWEFVRREAGALLWIDHMQELMVMDPEHRRELKVTPAEAEMAMRAWFCPADAPTDEQLCSFFEA
jgi:hypothetical protein